MGVTNMKYIIAVAVVVGAATASDSPFSDKRKSNDVLSNAQNLQKLLNAKGLKKDNNRPSNGREVKFFGDLLATTAAPVAKQVCAQSPTPGKEVCFDPAVLEKNKITTVESWSELHEVMEKRGEETHTQEDAVDELEQCVSKCKWKDKKWNGRSKHKEQMKEFEKGGVTNFKPVACVQCISKIPVFPGKTDIMAQVSN